MKVYVVEYETVFGHEGEKRAILMVTTDLVLAGKTAGEIAKRDQMVDISDQVEEAVEILYWATTEPVHVKEAGCSSDNVYITEYTLDELVQ